MLIPNTASRQRRSRIPPTLAVLMMACVLLGVAGQTAFAASIRGTAGPDDLRGTMGDDDIRALDGADTVRGLDGFDDIRGGAGNDTIYMGSGASFDGDSALGGPGDDTIHGQEGRDGIGGGAGDDVLRAGPGLPDVGGAGPAGDLVGGAGDDILVGGSYRDSLEGGRGDNRMWGRVGRDFAGGLGGEPGRDWYFMGPDNDDVVIEDDGKVDHVDCGRGTDTVHLESELDPLDVFVNCERPRILQ
jgi:Ca2+-binding RTX toxin-like protein